MYTICGALPLIIYFSKQFGALRILVIMPETSVRVTKEAVASCNSRVVSLRLYKRDNEAMKKTMIYHIAINNEV